MKPYKYSDQIYRYATMQQATDYFKMNKATIKQLAKEARAEIGVGRARRYDIPKMDELLEEKYTI